MAWSGVNADYLLAMAAKTRKTTATVAINIPGSDSIFMYDDDILAGSLSIDNASVSGAAFELGTVYTGQLKVTVNTPIDRFTLYGAEINALTQLYKTVTSEDFFSIYMGSYTIAEAVRSGNWVSITAYDKMIKFDKPYPAMGENEYIEGTPLAFLKGICTECGVTLGNTDAEITSWSPVSSISGDVITIGFSAEHSFDTYRGLLSQLATILGGYAIIGRDNKLYIKKYLTTQDTWTYSRDDDVKHREIADYNVQFTSAQVTFVSRTDKEEHTVYTDPSDISSVYAFSTDLLYAVTNTVELADVLDAIQTNIAAITYTPTSFTLMGNPAMDVGDRIVFTDKDGTLINTFIMHSTWIHHGIHTISAPGSNSAITSQTGSQKTQHLINTAVSGATCRFKTFTGGGNITVTAPDETNILTGTIQAKAGGTAFLVGSVNFTATVPGTFSVKVTVGGTPCAFTPKTHADGYATIAFYAPLSLSVGNNSLAISLAAADGGEATLTAGDCIAGAFSTVIQ